MPAQAPTQAEISETLLQVAKERYREGPGMAQESVVLREVAESLDAQRNTPLQQQILNAWHRLFDEGKLIWGYNIDNPGHPFYHFPDWVEHDSLPQLT